MKKVFSITYKKTGKRKIADIKLISIIKSGVEKQSSFFDSKAKQDKI